MTTLEAPEGIQDLSNPAKGLQLLLHKHWLSEAEGQEWFDTIVDHVAWYRVKYKSGRFQRECETPCWTAFYGGFEHLQPYTPVPSWLQPLVARVSQRLAGAPFNAMLLRLYFDGDEIAWHTDGRTFLGPTPTIASLSLGCGARFQLRRMTNVWPEPGGGCDGIDRATPPLDLRLGSGDLLVMSGETQRHWHHCVPKEKGRRPRININFRYIVPGHPDAARGQSSYYKYMVHGDDPDPPAIPYKEILQRRGSMRQFLQPRALQGSAPAPARTPAPNLVRSQPPPTAPCPLRPGQTPGHPSGTGTHGPQWECQACTLLNAPSACSCEACEAPRPTPARPAAHPHPRPAKQRKLNWSPWPPCVVGAGKAGAAEAAAMQQGPSQAVNTPAVHLHPTLSLSVPGPSDAGRSLSARAAVLAASPRSAFWGCDACTLRNDPSAACCLVCAAPRPSAASRATPGCPTVQV
mmetsp:Transcript_30662/g.55118  ORF Transcript_30662/g.55118 Transcript_30662/m.55118 type:complete len:462 (-) Transcript_30662:1335-2720(-)